MATTPIGVNTVTAISRRLILPKITDNIYLSNPLFFRWNRANKMLVKGGFQIEIPIMYAKMAAGGVYSGYQVLNVAPTDSIQNAALPWSQHFSAVTVDGRVLARNGDVTLNDDTINPASCISTTAAGTPFTPAGTPDTGAAQQSPIASGILLATGGLGLVGASVAVGTLRRRSPTA